RPDGRGSGHRPHGRCSIALAARTRHDSAGMIALGLPAARTRPNSAGMKKLHRYEVQPSVPAPLEPLFEIAYNLWWSWDERARELFARIDPDLYERVSEN